VATTAVAATTYNCGCQSFGSSCSAFVVAVVAATAVAAIYTCGPDDVAAAHRCQLHTGASCMQSPPHAANARGSPHTPHTADAGDTQRAVVHRSERGRSPACRCMQSPPHTANARGLHTGAVVGLGGSRPWLTTQGDAPPAKHVCGLVHHVCGCVVRRRSVTDKRSWPPVTLAHLTGVAHCLPTRFTLLLQTKHLTLLLLATRERNWSPASHLARAWFVGGASDAGDTGVCVTGV
jgi:hypothetical protein